MYLFTNKAHSEDYVAYRSPNIKVYAFEKVLEKWGEKQWASFSAVVNKESTWETTTAHYPTTKKSTAHGLCGFLNQTWVDTGFTKTDDPYTQIDACMVYISQRYKSPSKALEFHQKNGWY